MCDVTSIALGVASLAGTMYSASENQKAQRNVQKNMLAANGNYNSRIQQMADEQGHNMVTVSKGFSPDEQNAQYDQTKSDLQRQYVDQLPSTSGAAPLDVLRKSDNPIVQQEFEKKFAEGHDAGVANAQNAAAANTWQNNRFLNDVAVARNAQSNNMLDNFAKGQAPILKADTVSAQMSGQDHLQNAGLGSMFSSLAGMGAGWAYGASKGGGSTPSVPGTSYTNTGAINNAANSIGGSYNPLAGVDLNMPNLSNYNSMYLDPLQTPYAGVRT